MPGENINLKIRLRRQITTYHVPEVAAAANTNVHCVVIVYSGQRRDRSDDILPSRVVETDLFVGLSSYSIVDFAADISIVDS